MDIISKIGERLKHYNLDILCITSYYETIIEFEVSFIVIMDVRMEVSKLLSNLECFVIIDPTHTKIQIIVDKNIENENKNYSKNIAKQIQ